MKNRIEHLMSELIAANQFAPFRGGVNELISLAPDNCRI